MSPASRYGLGFVALVFLVTVLQFIAHALRSEPRDMRAIAERELTINTLAEGERVVTAISVFRRPAIDYFRATRGLLVLTDRRLIFLGLRPRDFLAAVDAPPTFEQRDFPIDTLVTVSKGRAMMWITPAVILRTPHEKLRLAVPSSYADAAQSLVAGFDERDRLLRERGVYQQQLRERAAAEREAAIAELRKPRYYTVQRGDAMGSIATRWNVTPETLRKWNNRPNMLVRVGESLMVWPGDLGD